MPLIDISKIHILPARDRITAPKVLKHAVKSIKRYGLMVPIIIYPKDRNKYWLIDGIVRLRACKKLGIKTINCIILDPTQTYFIEWVAKKYQEYASGARTSR